MAKTVLQIGLQGYNDLLMATVKNRLTFCKSHPITNSIRTREHNNYGSGDKLS